MGKLNRCDDCGHSIKWHISFKTYKPVRCGAQDQFGGVCNCPAVKRRAAPDKRKGEQMGNIINFPKYATEHQQAVMMEIERKLGEARGLATTIDMRLVGSMVLVSNDATFAHTMTGYFNDWENTAPPAPIDDAKEGA